MTSVLPDTSSTKIRFEPQNFILRDLLGATSGEEKIIDVAYVRDRCNLGLLDPQGQSGIPDKRCPMKLSKESGPAVQYGAFSCLTSGVVFVSTSRHYQLRSRKTIGSRYRCDGV